MSGGTPLLAPDERGLRCAAGDFWIDPTRPVERAVLTHAHADHARPGSESYLVPEASVPLLRARLGEAAVLEPVPWGERRTLGDAVVSFHPAGHVLGSAQVRVEGPGAAGGDEVWVASGDYKRDPDPTCEPFEVVPCDVFITEATFGLPLYRWEETSRVARGVLAWWDENRAAGRASILCAYSLGKAQRLLAELARAVARREDREGADGDRRVRLHGAVDKLTTLYRELGVEMLPARKVSNSAKPETFAGTLVVAPPAAAASPWIRRFGECRVGFASGWMRLRANRRRRGYDRGFVLSDHADWPGLVRTVEETGARRVLVTHGPSHALARWLREERGLDAAPLELDARAEAASADPVDADEADADETDEAGG